MKKTKMVRLLSMLLCMFLLASCETFGREKTTTDESEKQGFPENELVLLFEGTVYCRIVRPKSSSVDLMSMSSDLHNTILESTGASVDVVADTQQISDNLVEILIGDTNRAESAQAKEKLEDFQYSISVINGKLVVVGSDDVMLENAIRRLIEIVGNDFDSEKRNWMISLDYGKTYDGSGEYSYNSYIGKDVELIAEYTQIKELSLAQSGPATNGRFYRYMQGGCTDGTYYYYFMCTGGDLQPEKCRIVKIDLKTKTRVKISEELELFHAGDAVYNPYTKKLVVIAAWNNSYYEIDPETLTLKKTTFIAKSGGITYNTDKKIYVSLDDNYTLHYMDDDFKTIKKISRENYFIGFDLTDPQTYSAQGITSDSKYIYVLEYQILNSGGKDDIRNNLVVYDFSTGRFVQSIPLGMGVETENLIIWNDCIYVFCNNSNWSGAVCYQVNLIPKI